MRLLSIEIKNFRQFSGTHSMDLDVRGNRNVIVIHGENGSGKTTLLNAFKWCFYGKTDFDSNTDKLLNERVIAEAHSGARLDMSITVEFEHEELRYTAKREWLFTKQQHMTVDPIGEDVFTLTWIDADGKFQKAPSPETHINQILPEEMQPYFFFNGERIEKLAHVNAADQIKDAIKNLMGLEVVERASRHLSGPVIAKLRKDLKESSPKDLADAIERETAVSERITEAENKITLINKNIIEFKEELHLVNKALEKNADVANLSKERVLLEQQIVDVQATLEQLRRDRRDLASSMGGLAFVENLVKTSGEILEDKRRKGELPFKVKEQFISDLLQEGNCICGRDLAEGSAPYYAVEAFRRSTTAADVENAFIETSGTLSHMQRSRSELFSSLSTFQAKESAFNDEIRQKEGRIETITSEIGDRESEDIAALEAKRGRLIEQIEKAGQEKGAVAASLPEWERQLSDLRKEREKLSEQNAKGEIAARRLRLAEEVKRVVDSLYASLAEHVRARLSTKVDDTFKSVMRKPYWAEISKDYTLQIYKDVGGHKQLVYEKSTGENQITSLAFVGSIVSIAKQQSTAENENFRGGVFPIVMDSPFGALDVDYRLKVAEYIPELAEQVIIMASGSQWQGAVEQQVTPRMAREYTLHYFTPAPDSSSGLQGVEKSEKFEYTEIREGYHGG